MADENLLSLMSVFSSSGSTNAAHSSGVIGQLGALCLSLTVPLPLLPRQPKVLFHILIQQASDNRAVSKPSLLALPSTWATMAYARMQHSSL